MILIWVTAVLGHPLDVTQVHECRRISPSVQARERRGRGNQGRDERVVPGHAAMRMRPFTLETVVGLTGLLAWLMFSKYSLHLNCPLLLVLVLSTVRKPCWPGGAGWVADTGSSLDSQQLKAK